MATSAVGRGTDLGIDHGLQPEHEKIVMAMAPISFWLIERTRVGQTPVLQGTTLSRGVLDAAADLLLDLGMIVELKSTVNFVKHDLALPLLTVH